MNIEKILEIVKKGTWYMQGGEILPFFSHMVYLIGPTTLGNEGIITINKGTQNWAYLDKLKEKKLADTHLSNFFKNPDYLKEKMNLLLKNIKICEKKFDELLSLKPEEKERFHNLVKETSITHLAAWNLTFIIDHFDPWAEHYLTEYSSKYNLTSEEVSILSAPYKFSYIQKEAINFLEIIESRNKNKIQEHYDKYHWYKTSWQHATILDIEYFEDKFERYTKNADELRKEVEGYKKNFKGIETEREKLLKKYDFDDKTKKIFEFFSQLNDFRDLRKHELTNKFNYKLYELLIKIAEHTKVDIKILENMAFFELEDYDSSEELIKKLKKRRKEYSAMCYDKNNKPFFIYGEDAEKIKKALDNRLLENSENINGRTAYPGKITGTAKLVNSIKDMEKVSEGDILVSIMTRPELVSAMKKAGAIVTDEGGITCHAAIISRELKIPCVVGTQVATQILKDGDLIEVDADKGTVRRIQK